MRSFIFSFALLPGTIFACTTFKVTRDGRTLIGCNEDAWSINAQVRFEQGRDGGYGSIYFGHFNGSPMRSMTDQMGMNAAGLVFDGLSVQRGPFTQRPGLRWVSASDAVVHAMRTCANVQEVAAYARTVQVGLVGSMLFFCDAKGDYLVMEPDTMFLGHDPWYALGNWRMSTCSDPDAIPIPRLQAGRALLAEGVAPSMEDGARVLESMKACRSKLGEGTLFSAVFDPELGQAHLYFYHDFRERVTFDLEQELAKGDRTIDMASLFGARPEYDVLKSHVTPFHRRWLFWMMAVWDTLTVLLGIVCFLWLLREVVRMLRRRPHGPFLTPVLLGLVNVVLFALLSTLLFTEAPYYFGLGDTHPALAWLPALLIVLMVGLLYLRTSRTWRLLSIAQVIPVLALLGFWGLLWP